jgi:hypothetical protein
MKKIYFFLLTLISLYSFSQAPKLINYQGIVRSAAGNPVTSPVKVKFEIFPSATGGTAAFSEVQTTNTNSLGLFSTQIGKVTPLALNWSTGSWYLELSVDTTNSGSSFVTVGRQQMVSVPFALYAENAGSAPDPSVTFSNNILYVGTNSVSIPAAPVYSAGNGIAINSGSIINTAMDQSVSITAAGNASVTSAYPNFTVESLPQVLSINSNSISLSNGGGLVVLPATSSTPNTSVTASGIATVTSSGTNTFNVAVTAPTFSGTGGTTVSGTYPNFLISSSVPVNPNITGTGVASTTASGNNYTVNVPGPVLSMAGNAITVTQGTASSTALLPAPPPTTVTGSGVAVITPTSGSSFNVNVPAPNLSMAGNALTVTQGTASSTVLLPVPPPTTVTGSGVAVVTPTSGSNFNVNVPGPQFTYNSSTGLFSLIQGSSTFNGNISPSASISGNTLAVGNSTVNIPFWSFNGNAGTNASSNFIGTTDNVPLNFRVNNQKSGVIDPSLSNTFFGYWSGKSNTTGSQNTANGINSLLNNTTGSGNSAFGTSAMETNTSGNKNTALGITSLFSNSTGSLNTAAGYQSLYANTTGSLNSAFGGNALSNNTTGYFNSAFGAEAMLNHSSGIANTGLGYQALYWNNGNYNVGVGFGVMQNNYTGGSNTALGTTAGYNSTGSGNVFIGFAAGYSATGNNQLYIANSSSGLPLVFGDFSTGRIGLGTTTPGTRLEIVNSTAGALRIADGSQAAGKVFTSDGTGLGSWQLPAATPGSGTPNFLPKWNAAGTGLTTTSSLYDTGILTGVGTSAPSTRLHLLGVNNTTFLNAFSGSPETAIRIHNGDQTNNNFSSLIFSTDASNSSSFEAAKIAAVNVNHTAGAIAGDLVFMTRNSANINEVMRINSAGNVGIGTLSPSQRLEVVGNVEIPATNDYMYSAPKTGYVSMPAVAFRSESPTAYECTFLSGCMYPSGTTPGTATYFDAPIYLPDGATITSLDAYIVDNDANYNASGVWLWQQPGSIGSTYGSPVIMGNTPGTSGQSTVIQKFTTTTFSPSVINNAVNSYYIRVGLAQSTTAGDIRIAKVVVTYSVNKTD